MSQGVVSAIKILAKTLHQAQLDALIESLQQHRINRFGDYEEQDEGEEDFEQSEEEEEESDFDEEELLEDDEEEVDEEEVDEEEVDEEQNSSKKEEGQDEEQSDEDEEDFSENDEENVSNEEIKFTEDLFNLSSDSSWPEYKKKVNSFDLYSLTQNFWKNIMQNSENEEIDFWISYGMHPISIHFYTYLGSVETFEKALKEATIDFTTIVEAVCHCLRNNKLEHLSKLLKDKRSTKNSSDKENIIKKLQKYQKDPKDYGL